MKRHKTWAYLLFWIVISLVTMFPIYWLFVISVKPAVELFSTPDVILKSLYWKNYVDVISDETLRGYMANSLIISTGNAVLVTVLGFLACYALAAFDLGGKESIFFWTITNRMAPPAVFLLPLFLLLTQVYRFGDFTLLDSKIGMILVYCTFNLPFAIWTLSPTLDSIPKELDEAAFVDGASAWTVITEIVLPLGAAGPRGDPDPDLGLRLERVSPRRHADELQRPDADHRPFGICDHDRDGVGRDGDDLGLHADPGADHLQPGAAPHRGRPDLRRGERMTP